MVIFHNSKSCTPSVLFSFHKSVKNVTLVLYKTKVMKYNASCKQHGTKPETKKEIKIMKKFLAIALALIFVLSCFAGCGAKIEEQIEEKIEEKTEGKKTISVGYTLYAPMNYMEGETLVGFDTDLAKAVFEGLGYEVTFVEIDWDAKYTDLESGAIDCIWNGFTANSADPDGIQRAEKVDFSYNYMENRQVIVAKTDSGITSAADLSGKAGSVESGSAGESYAAGFEGATVKGASKQTDCLMEVMSGAADFAVLDAQLAKSYVGKGDYTDLMIIEELSSDVEFYAIGFEKGSELTAQVNEQLEKLAADGTIAKIAEKYGVTNTTITDFSDQK